MGMNKEALAKFYREITSLYDMAEELATTVESEFTKNPETQLAIVEPVIAQLADSADILSEEFVNVLEKPTMIKSAKGRVEGALRKVFMALDEYRQKVGERSKSALNTIVNIADPIVHKIRKQTERVILIFMQLMEISLERIMHKFELEEFKRANDRMISTITPMVGH